MSDADLASMHHKQLSDRGQPQLTNVRCTQQQSHASDTPDHLVPRTRQADSLIASQSSASLTS